LEEAIVARIVLLLLRICRGGLEDRQRHQFDYWQATTVLYNQHQRKLKEFVCYLA
jgi:hypothetical protein